MTDDEEEEEEKLLNMNFPMPNPTLWLFTKLISLQADIIYNSLLTLTSPFFFLFSIASDSYHHAQMTKQNVVQSVLHAATSVPSTVARRTTIFLRKIGLGLVGAAYVGIVVTMVMIVAVVLGVGLVQLWVEEPVFVKEILQFDYSDVHPKAVLLLRNGGGSEGYFSKRKQMGVTVGHTFYVRLLLLLPESDFNMEIGVFQVTAELISTNGAVIAKSSHPCVLRFRSLPIRLMRTFLLSIPLLLGITAETQKISIPMIKHKEGYPRTKAVRITLIPRAGTSYVPQLYEAEIVLNSQLPWRKELVRSWKWTICVWTSLYIYLTLLILLVCCFKPLIHTAMTMSERGHSERDLKVAEEPQQRGRMEREVSETMRRWQKRRGKRKESVGHGVVLPETVGSSASSISITREDTSSTVEEDTGDSEWVYFRS